MVFVTEAFEEHNHCERDFHRMCNNVGSIYARKRWGLIASNFDIEEDAVKGLYSEFSGGAGSYNNSGDC